MRTAVFAFLFMFSSAALAGGAVTLPQVGKHYPVFVFEKNENPQNIMVAYVKLDDQCHLQRDPKTKQPLFDFYWLMDHQRYKPVHSLIKKGIRERLEFDPSSVSDKGFAVRLNDLKELKQDLERPLMQVSARPKGSDCSVQGTMTLGPSDGNQTIRLEKIYSDASKTVYPPFRKVKAVRLTGVTLNSGKPIARTYAGK